jgi:hypothetical protein
LPIDWRTRICRRDVAGQPGVGRTQQVRRQLLKADANKFYFQHMADLFDTRSVTRAGAVWALPREDQPIHFQYEWQGQRLERTKTFGSDLHECADRDEGRPDRH